MNNTLASFNTTKAPTFPYTNDITWAVAYSLQLFISIIGNVLILWIIYNDNRLKTTTNFLVANMAVSDLLAALIVIPDEIVSINTGNPRLFTGYINLSKVLCKISHFADNTCLIVSINSCVFIAIDRYYAVAHPFTRHFQKKTKRIIAGIWIWSCILSAPQLYFRVRPFDKPECTVSFKDLPFYKVYTYFFYTASSGLAFVVIIITYTLTVYKLYRHKAPGLPNSAVQRREQQNKKVLKMAITVVALLYICHGTWYIYIILLFEGELNHLSPASRHKLSRATVFVLCLSLCYNLFVYLVFNDIYRENIKTMISKCCRRCGLRQNDITDNRNFPGVPAVVEITEIKTAVKLQSKTSLT